MDRIKDEGDLLERYYQAELSCIWEYSTSMQLDTRDLRDQVKDYATRNNLNLEWLDKK